MRHDVNAVWDLWQAELFESQDAFEEQAVVLYKKGKKEELLDYLTAYTMGWGDRVVEKAWELGDMLWTKYDEQF